MEVFSPSDICRINGLTRRSDLNGIEVELLKFVDEPDTPESGRWAVMPTNGNKGMRVRPANLELVMPSPTKAATAEAEAIDATTGQSDGAKAPSDDANGTNGHSTESDGISNGASNGASNGHSNGHSNDHHNDHHELNGHAAPSPPTAVVEPPPPPLVQWLMQAANCFCPAAEEAARKPA